MAESNGDWGALNEYDSEFAEAWDGLNTLPERGENVELDEFLDSRNLTTGDLLRIGTRIDTDGVTLIHAHPKGLKYRRITDGKRWTFPGSSFDEPKIVQRYAEPANCILLVEGETDAARMSNAPYKFDVGIISGASNFPQSAADALSAYDQVLIGFDNDQAGEDGAKKIWKFIPHAQRFAPPEGCNDWCEVTEQWPSLPEAPVILPIIVKAGDLFELEVPDIASWFSDALLPVGGSAIIHGWAKNYKSYTGLDMLSALSQGEPWCEFDPTNEPAKVCVMQFEIPFPYYRERIVHLFEHAAEPELFKENFLTYSPIIRPKIAAGDTKAEDLILTHLLENNVNIFYIDPIRRATGGADLNDEKEVRALLGFIERINDYGITTIAVHHDNKSGAKDGGGGPLSMTGSGAFAGDPDTIFSIVRPHGHSESSTQRNIEFTIRNGPMVTPRGFEMEPTGQLSYRLEPWGAPDKDGNEEPSI